ncbi:MAG: hypothetical protein ACREOO_00050 [bacterium]
MNNSTSIWDTIGNSGFDIKLFLLVILLSMWLGASFKSKDQSSRLMQILGELAIGLLIGLALGVLWNMNYYPGIFTVSALTLAVMMFFNTKPDNQMVRFIAILAGLGMAIYVYYSYWGSMTYLWDILTEDFRGI